MKQNHPKKLSLRKKAISNLNSAEMRQINGGGIFVSTYVTQFCNPVIVTAACNPIIVTSFNTVR
jgi:Tfp pilus assembly protein PilZ